MELHDNGDDDEEDEDEIELDDDEFEDDEHESLLEPQVANKLLFDRAVCALTRICIAGDTTK